MTKAKKLRKCDLCRGEITSFPFVLESPDKEDLWFCDSCARKNRELILDQRNHD